MSTACPAPPALQRVSDSGQRWPLLDVSRARAHEAQARAAHPGASLMERAGLVVARLALALAPRGRHAVVVCGPGDNGGDGLVAARHLLAAGWNVTTHRIAAQRPPSPDTAAALDAALRLGLVPTACPGRLAPADLVIDALLGLGSARAPAGDVARAITAVRASSAPVLSVDLPSGLHPDTGAVLGHEAVRAAATVCALSLRPGCFTHQGRDHAGQVWLADLGHPAREGSAWLAAAAPRPPRDHASHKGRYGDVIVVGGATGMGGAAKLAAEAALAAGAGRVYLSLLDPAAAPALRPELMSRPLAWATEPSTLAHATVVAGCGGSEAVAAVLPPLLAHAARLLLDADALNAIAAEPALRQALRARSARGRPTLLTPHPLEAARLLGTDVQRVQQDRFAAAQALADDTGAAVLLKGSGSLIAAPGRRPSVNASGNAALASAGTGDVLAGWAAGRWGAEPAAAATGIAEAVAWLHGHAADVFAAAHPGRPLRAADLIERMLRAG
jgi:hydroxyethylthiazole kinase-like uncharacterized protein yjeF